MEIGPDTVFKGNDAYVLNRSTVHRSLRSQGPGAQGGRTIVGYSATGEMIYGPASHASASAPTSAQSQAPAQSLKNEIDARYRAIMNERPGAK